VSPPKKDEKMKQRDQAITVVLVVIVFVLLETASFGVVED
jgi:hypothetical protein